MGWPVTSLPRMTYDRTSYSYELWHYLASWSLTVLLMQGRSQPHSPWRARVPLSTFFPQISINFSSNFTYFLPHFGPPGGRVAHPGALATPLCSWNCKYGKEHSQSRAQSGKRQASMNLKAPLKCIIGLEWSTFCKMKVPSAPPLYPHFYFLCVHGSCGEETKYIMD